MRINHSLNVEKDDPSESPESGDKKPEKK
ncbi:hypothetical protein [Pseudescherichia vulneris]